MFGGPGFPHRGTETLLANPLRAGRFGGALQWLDLDRDSCDELAIGAPTYDAAAPNVTLGTRGEGRVFLLDPGRIDPRVPVGYSLLDDPTPDHGRDFRGFGTSLAAGHLDVNDDQDLIIGNPRAVNGGRSYAGEIQIVIH